MLPITDKREEKAAIGKAPPSVIGPEYRRVHFLCYGPGERKSLPISLCQPARVMNVRLLLEQTARRTLRPRGLETRVTRSDLAQNETIAARPVLHNQVAAMESARKDVS